LSVYPVSAPNFITIFQCDLLSYDAPDLRLRVRCSKGTYIRSLAHDIGCKLNCGGHLSQLRRTHSDNLSVEQAVPLDTLLEEPMLLKQHLVPLKALKALAENTTFIHT
jgi:tRNA pseudouridine55 synthase